MTKYIFVTGGVLSGIGKGITVASIGRLLKSRGLKVVAQKFDPYFNVDPGTMSPLQHGEVFVTDDGIETDLDLGHYERFIDENVNKFSSMTAGKLYWSVLNKERNGEYLGETIQVIPHITNAIKECIYSVGRQANADVVITEIGGTIGDIEGQPFLEAARQIYSDVGPENCLFIMVTLVPYIKSSQEHKTKPTQHAVRELQSMGVMPKIIVVRCDEPIDSSIIDKIALFCDVKRDSVIVNQTVPVLYDIPIMLEKYRMSDIICRNLHIDAPVRDLSDWEAMLGRLRARNRIVKIGLVGKYTKLHDAYLSVSEALTHGGLENGAEIMIKWIDSESISPETVNDILSDCSGIIVPGGFGKRGTDGMLLAIKYARENDVPFLGICLGMQMAVVEFARDVCGIADANSREFDEYGERNVIDYMPDQNNEMPKGGTMRLGAYPCHIKEDTRMAEAYKQTDISERHRHRLEFNNTYREMIEEHGMVVSGESPDGRIVETVEIPANRFFVAVQYHPEFKSRPNRAHPLFAAFIKAALEGRG